MRRTRAASTSGLMGGRMGFQTALNFTKLSVCLACTWPPTTITTKWQIVRYNLSWCVSFLSVICLFFPLIFSIYEYNENSIIVTQSACFVGSTSNLMIKMIVYRIHLKRTQNLIREMEDFFENAQPHEIIVLQRYVARCSIFHGFISILNYLTAAGVIFSPFLLHDQSFPTNAVYPFSLDSVVVKSLVYVHQGIVGFQCSSGVTVDCQAAVMMWFAGARLEILADEMKNIFDVRGFDDFVRKHKKLLSYADEVSKTTCYIALASSVASGLTAIMSALQLFGNQPLAEKMQFVPVAFIAALNLFVCAWPADNLINVCDLLGNAVYDILWVEMPVSITKKILMVIQRCQRPIIVSIGGFMPTLSLHSYARFLSGTLSYVTTLRLVVTSDSSK